MDLVDNQNATWRDIAKRFMDMPVTPDQKSRPNVFSLSGFPDRETVSSNILSFFLDPKNEHGLGDLVLSSLLSEIDAQANDPGMFDGMDISSCTVSTEHTTAKGNRIDILIEFEDTAIVIENKVNATLYNPLDDYQNDIRNAGYEKVLVVVLHQHDGSLISSANSFGFKPGHDLFDISYGAFFDRVLDGLGHASVTADLRCVDILHQFIENYSDERIEQIMETQDKSLKNYTEQIEGVEEGVHNVIASYAKYEKTCMKKLNSIQDSILQLNGPDSEENLRVDGYTVHLEEHWAWHSKGFPTYRAFKYRIDEITDGTEWSIVFEFGMHEPWHVEPDMSTNSIGAIWYKAYWAPRTKGIGEDKQKRQAITEPFLQRLNAGIAECQKAITDELVERRNTALENAIRKATTEGLLNGSLPSNQTIDRA